MELERENTLRQQAWACFTFHTELRLRFLKIFAVLAAVLVAGAVCLLREGASQWLILPVAILLPLLAALFWLLDRHNATRAGKATAALKALETEPAQPVPAALRLFESGEAGKPAPQDGFAGTYAGVYGLAALVGLYLAVLPFVAHVHTASSVAATTPVPPQGAIPQRPMPGVGYPMPPSMTPPHRPNFLPPATPFPRPPVVPTVAPHPVLPPSVKPVETPK